MARKFKVFAPVRGYRGDVGSLLFRDGVAEADEVRDAATLAYCRRKGYQVEPIGGGHGGSDGPPAKNASKAEWVDYAVSQGADRDAAEDATKDDLIAGRYATGRAGAEPGEPAQPKGNASKAEWVDYAVARGADHDEADAMTRDDLAATYGKDS
jgi:hypothetical protein